MIAYTVPCHGTWGRASSWYKAGSVWMARALQRGVTILDIEEPFTWSGELGGVTGGLSGDDPKDPWDQGKLAPWAIAGKALNWYVQAKLALAGVSPFTPVNLVTHSHGAQVAWYAMAYGLKVARWIDVSGPVRADLAALRLVEASRVALLVHTFDPHDAVLKAGELGDGHLGHQLRLPQAHFNIEIPGPGHSGILNELVDLWDTIPLWKYLVDPLEQLLA